MLKFIKNLFNLRKEIDSLKQDVSTIREVITDTTKLIFTNIIHVQKKCIIISISPLIHTNYDITQIIEIVDLETLERHYIPSLVPHEFKVGNKAILTCSNFKIENEFNSKLHFKYKKNIKLDENYDMGVNK